MALRLVAPLPAVLDGNGLGPGTSRGPWEPREEQVLVPASVPPPGRCPACSLAPSGGKLRQMAVGHLLRVAGLFKMIYGLLSLFATSRVLLFSPFIVFSLLFLIFCLSVGHSSIVVTLWHFL